MTSEPHRRSDGRDTVVGWSALGAAALAVFAWAACCVLPMALSVAGLSLAGTAVFAGQRTWLTVATVIVLSAGWWMVWRRRRACVLDATCAPPSGLMVGLLSAATVLTGLALIWQPLIEPYFLMLLRTARG
ncbi:MAG: MFS transporter permease [Phenylobacterium sp.]|uniref:MFS transporter permease n=1 Tax=Phenylobacterium sp. TaxID=1871053 RepID=UPI002732E908|nr:MFS transporter permease [Phenylobacterium sp.]MDP3747361.1 MFS transporter permease [Phenylobacterium sp.]